MKVQDLSGVGVPEEDAIVELLPQVTALVQRVVSLAQRRAVVEVGVRVPRGFQRRDVIQAIQGALQRAGFADVAVVTSPGEGALDLEVIEFDR